MALISLCPASMAAFSAANLASCVLAESIAALPVAVAAPMLLSLTAASCDPEPSANTATPARNAAAAAATAGFLARISRSTRTSDGSRFVSSRA